jgi:hypothetical protein
MQTFSTRIQSLVSVVAARLALAAAPLKTRGLGPAFAAAYRRIGSRMRWTVALLATMGAACGSVATAQSAQFLDWTTPVGGSFVGGAEYVALDPSGNIYTIEHIPGNDSGGTLAHKIPASDPTCSTPGDCIQIAPNYPFAAPFGGTETPESIAADNSGNVYLNSSIQLIKVPATDLTCSTPGDCIQIAYNESGFGNTDLWVDGSGNVYTVAGIPNGEEVVKYTLSGNTYTPSTLLTWQSPNAPSIASLAVDAGGNLYFGEYVDLGGHQSSIVVKYTFSGGIYTPTTLDSLAGYSAITLDPSGNIYGEGGDTGIAEFTPSGGTYTQSLIFGGGPSLAADGSGDVYYATGNAAPSLFESHSGPVNFGSVNVGSTSASIQLNFLNDSGVFQFPFSVLTQGATSQDFAASQTFPGYDGAATCGAHDSGSPCLEYVQLTPTMAGERQGAADLYAYGATIATAYLQGTGVAPQVVIYPGTETAPYTALSSGLGAPSGVAIDGFGDVYIADAANNQVVAQVSNGQIVVANAASNGLASPAGMALDGAGNVYIADAGNSRIVQEILSNPSGTAIQVGSGYSYTQATLTTSALSAPQGVAVDGAGNVYIADTGNNRVLMESLSNGTYTESTLGSDLLGPAGVAVDGSGNVYIADTGNGRVLKEMLSGGVYTQSVLVGSLNAPQGVSVDGSGNVYIADTGNNRVLLEAFSSGSYTQIVVASGLNSPQAVTVIGNGNVYIADTNNQRVVLVDVSDPETLTFPVTPLGNSSSPQTLTVVNIGNAPLSFTVPAMGDNPAIGADFTLNGSDPSACPAVGSGASEAGTLAAGVTCQLSISFTPTTTLAVNESLVLTDNHLNGANVTQTISLQGDGLVAPTITWPTPSPISYGTALSATQLDATANVAGTFVYTPALGTVLPLGTQTLSVTFTPADAVEYAAATASVTLTVFPPGEAAAQPVFSVESGTYTTPLAVAITDATAGATIYYTTDGSTPTINSFVYAGPIPVTASETITAVAAGSGAYYLSSVAAATYTINGISPIITTVAGDGVAGYSGDGGPATSAELNVPYGVLADGSGNFYIADYYNSAVRKVTPAGTITTIAGNGTAGYSGDGGPATSAQLYEPASLALDSSGDLYIGDRGNNTVREVTPAGIISTVAGTGIGGYSGDNGPATSAQLNGPYGLIFDASGNLYISEYFNQRVREVTPAGTITTIAGTGTAGFSGDGGLATSAMLNGPVDIAIDLSGNLYIVDDGNDRIRMINPSGTITTVVGNGGGGFSGDGGPATSATMSNPNGMTVDANGVLYIADTFNERIRRVDQFGTITTVAGNGGGGFSGDGGPAIDAEFSLPSRVSLDAAGNYYIADPYNYRIRKLTAFSLSQTITFNPLPGVNYGVAPFALSATASSGLPVTFTVSSGPASITNGVLTVTGAGTVVVAANQAGNSFYSAAATVTQSFSVLGLSSAAQPVFSVASGTYSTPQMVGISDATAGATIFYTTDGSTPTTSSFVYSGPIPVTASETINAVAGGGAYNLSSVATATYTINVTSPIITTVAGDGIAGYSGDGGPATSAELNVPYGVLADGSGNFYIADYSNPVVRKVNAAGTITTIAGNGTAGYSGDGGPATSAELSLPTSLALDSSGNLYIGDTGNNTVREVTPAGTISTVAGNGTAGYSGDGGPATSAELNGPYGVALDANGNLYISEYYNERVRKVTPAGTITTIAGTGTAGFSGDGGPASSAMLSGPIDVALDLAGNLYIAEQVNDRIRMINPSGIITTVVGNGGQGFSGDGGPATSAMLNRPQGVRVDANGVLYIADTYNNRIRTVGQFGTITTVAGNGAGGFGGDGGPAIDAELNTPSNVSLDAAGNYYIADIYNNRIRKVTVFSLSQTITFNPLPGVNYGVAPFALSATASSGLPVTFTVSSGPASITNGVLTVTGSGTVVVAANQAGNSFYSPAPTVTQSFFVLGIASSQPLFSVASGTYSTPQMVGISDATAGATIYYTTDGSTPTTSSFVYSGPIPVTATETINAVAGGGAYNLSPVATATYTINGLTPIITTVAGEGTAGNSGDGGPATSAELNVPYAVLADGSGNFYIADYYNSAVRKVTPAGTITTIAGNGTAGYSGDGGPATSAQLYEPASLALDSSGDLYIGDRGNNTVREVTPAGIISTVAGTGIGGYSGDNGPATSAQLNGPYGLIFDASGNLYISEYFNQRVREVTPAGTITTIAGTGTAGFSGDGGLATSAMLNGPVDIAIDLSGNLYIVDDGNDRIRMINPSGTITTVVGNGGGGFSGDGGPATSATMSNPNGMTVDANGVLYIADTFNERIRRVDQFGTITTVAGNGGGGFSGDGGPAIDAEFSLPSRVSLDAAGNYYIADIYNNRIRKVTVFSLSQTITFNPLPGVNYGVAPFALSATASSGLPVTFTVSSGPASIANGVLTVTGAGTVVVAANQAGNSSYSAAATVTQSFSVLGLSSAAQPVFSVASGTYTTTQVVAITDATAGATIYYTTNGSSPTINSLVYSGTIPVTASETINAVAGGGPYNLSSVATAAYTIAPATAPGDWTWVGGSTVSSGATGGVPGLSGIYGTLGVASQGNIPGSRASEVSWTDASGNRWLLGGVGYDIAGNTGFLNDLWMFNPSTFLWTWMGGSSTASPAGVYGTLGTAAAGNVPGGRAWGATWTDSTGNLWLFGGWGIDVDGTLGILNDLWEFNPSTKQWTWIAGGNTVNQSGVYGTFGTAAAGNIPGSRYESAAWTDSYGRFWLFGGVDPNINYLGDLWLFDPSTKQWAWMGGNGSNVNQSGVYGTLGEPAAGNIPGGHGASSTWTDRSGNLWLFAGGGFDVNGTRGPLNDLWEFSPATNLWAWMGGSKLQSQNGVYGTLGTPAATNIPGARQFPASWKDSSGNLWLLGGLGLDGNGNTGSLNDFWEFNPSTIQWTWMGGSSAVPNNTVAGVYGILGVPAPGNSPGSRVTPSSWTDSSGNFWLFGGSPNYYAGSSSDLNDLWEYQPTQPTASQTITFNLLPNVTYGLAPFQLSATATSRLPVTFTISSGPASITNNVLTVSGAGTVVVAANQAGNTNYGAAATVTQSFTVAQAHLTVTVHSASATYGAAQPAFSGTIAGLLNSDTLTPTYSSTGTASSPVGTYPITATLSGSALANYSPTIMPGTLTITPARLTVTPVNVSAIYGAAPPAFTDNITGFFNGDSAATAVSGAPLLTTTAVQGSPVGTYTITTALGSLTAANYTFTLRNGTLTIKAATLTVTASPATSVYQAALPAFTYTASGFVNSDSASILAGDPTETTTVVQGSSAGNYTIKIVAGTLSAGSNYTLSFVNGTLTITKAVLTVTPNSVSKVYGRANPALTVAYSGFLGTDTSSVVHGAAALTTTAVTSSGVGSYQITATVGTLSATNYTFTIAGSGTLIVNSAILTVIANNKTATYGAALPAFTDSITGFVNGDSAATVVTGTASLTTTAVQGSPVGTDIITAAIGSLSAVNYTFAFTNGTLTIDPAHLTVAAVDVSAIYGAPLPTFTYNITGFVNGDSAATAVGGAPLLTTTAVQGSPTGTYTISDVLSTLTAANYSFSLKTGTLTIKAATLTATASPATSVYQAALPTFTFTASGLVDPEKPTRPL